MGKQEYMDIYFNKYVPIVTRLIKDRYSVIIKLCFITDLENVDSNSTLSIGYIVRVNSCESRGTDFMRCLIRAGEMALQSSWIQVSEEYSITLSKYNALANMFIDYEVILQSYKSCLESNNEHKLLYMEKANSAFDVYVRAFNHILTI